MVVSILMDEPLGTAPSSDPRPEPVPAGPSSVVVFIEAMSEEQVALLAEDLVKVLVRRPARQRREVASEPP